MRLDASYRLRQRDRLLLFLMIALVTYLGTRLEPAGFEVPMWAPDTGIGLIALLAVRRERWPCVVGLVAAGGLLGALLSGARPEHALAEMAATVFETLVTTLLYLRVNHRQGRIDTAKDAFALAFCSAATALVSNTFLVSISGPGEGLPSWYVVLGSVAAHAIGTVAVAALFLVENTATGRMLWSEVALQTLLLAVLILTAFTAWQWRPSPFLVFLPLVWAGIRFSPRITALQVMALSTYCVVTSLAGYGPFATFSKNFSVADASMHLVDRVHSFSASLLVVGLTLSLTVNAANSKTVALAESEDLLRQTIDESMTGMFLLQLSDDGTDVVLQGNPVAAEFFGVTTAEVVGRSFLERLPHEPELVFDAMWGTVHGHLRDWRGEVKALRHDGARRVLSVGCFPIRDAHGLVHHLSVQFLDVTGQHDAREHLARLALHDGLTGLGNRMLMEDRLQYGLDSNVRDQERLLLMFLDLDDFKVVNDGSGHEVGDQVLIEVAHRLTALTRPQDTVCRLGGDEFVVLVPQVPEPAEPFADLLSSRLLTSLSAPIEVNGREHRVGASIGMSLSRPTSTATQLVREADSAMYEAKRAGKNCRARYDVNKERSGSPNGPMLQQLNEALDHGEFQLHVQPVIDLTTGRLTGGESLIRWRHPKHGVLQPSAWLDVAENSDLVYGLGSWVIREACRIAAQWQARLGEDAPVMHANVSARQLGHGTLVADVRDALTSSGLSPDKLVLELTETQLERSEHAVQEEFDALRELGIQLAADDFGTGYSSLTRLTDMPIDILKIDRTFVARMRDDERAGAVVAALVTMGSKLGLEVVAEGVETVTDARHLRNLGCTRAQGYLWSKAVPPQEFLKIATASVASRQPRTLSALPNQRAVGTS